MFVRTRQPIGMGNPVKVAARTKSGTAVIAYVIVHHIRVAILVSNARVVVPRPVTVTDVVVRGRTRIGTGVVV